MSSKIFLNLQQRQVRFGIYFPFRHVFQLCCYVFSRIRLQGCSQLMEQSLRSLGGRPAGRDRGRPWLYKHSKPTSPDQKGLVWTNWISLSRWPAKAIRTEATQLLNSHTMNSIYLTAGPLDINYVHSWKKYTFIKSVIHCFNVTPACNSSMQNLFSRKLTGFTALFLCLNLSRTGFTIFHTVISSVGSTLSL